MKVANVERAVDIAIFWSMIVFIIVLIICMLDAEALAFLLVLAIMAIPLFFLWYFNRSDKKSRVSIITCETSPSNTSPGVEVPHENSDVKKSTRDKVAPKVAPTSAKDSNNTNRKRKSRVRVIRIVPRSNVAAAPSQNESTTTNSSNGNSNP